MPAALKNLSERASWRLIGLGLAVLCVAGCCVTFWLFDRVFFLAAAGIPLGLLQAVVGMPAWELAARWDQMPGLRKAGITLATIVVALGLAALAIMLATA